ncbi:cyclin-dependent kinase 2-associated protein 2 isoform X1 [Hippocampus zosterae]|uniref:cyclin-dependent kinase 2-associated protein 2 isoform X1 n=1 Tax=Hippocampus zosterae TaxID=109293 RepID=UPI00223D84C6|nr:cyclin-dependent kinase 2-associated protein 2 isoform X1 [Hippocampus zosterae]
MSYKPIAPAPSGSNHTPPGSSVPSPSLPSSSNFRPAFSDFGPPSMGFVQPVKVSQGSTYSELLSVIEEMSREIRPTYAGSKSAMERLKRGIKQHSNTSTPGILSKKQDSPLFTIYADLRLVMGAS